MTDVFISYSRKDTTVADRICQALDGAGISYFIDRQGIGGGMEFPEVLANAILKSKVFLFLGSKNSYESRFTNSEIIFAFNKKDRNHLLPYIIDEAPLPLALEFTFAGINWRNISTHPIETVLVDDILDMLGRPRKATPSASVKKAAKTKKASEADVKALKEQANKLYSQGDKTAAAPLYEQAAAAGDGWSYMRLGWIYYDYSYGASNDRTIEMWQKAADLDEWNALCYMGEIMIGWDQSLSEGRINLPLGMQYLERAASWHHAAAERILGELLVGLYPTWFYAVKGVKAEPDIPRGISLLEQAGRDDDPEAWTVLGEMYYHGRQVGRDYAKALKYFEMVDSAPFDAKDRRKVNARRHLTAIYERGGHGVKSDLTKAMKIARDTLSAGCDAAYQFMVPILYRLGKYDMALDFFEKSEKLRPEARSSYYAALISGKGLAGTPDLQRAREILEHATPYDEHGIVHFLLVELCANEQSPNAAWIMESARKLRYQDENELL